MGGGIYNFYLIIQRIIAILIGLLLPAVQR